MSRREEKMKASEEKARRGKTEKGKDKEQKDESHVPREKGAEAEVEEGDRWWMKKEFNGQMRREKGTIWRKREREPAKHNHYSVDLSASFNDTSVFLKQHPRW